MTGPAAFLTTFLACLVAIAVAFLLWLASGGVAGAHEAASGWLYPSGCCYSAATSPTGDCAPISGRYVTEQDGGYMLDLPVGAHPKLVTKGYRGFVPKKDARPSGDFDYHLCRLAGRGHPPLLFRRAGVIVTASARGLFRATGKASKPVAARMLDDSIAKVEHLEREPDEFYPTPVEPTRAFLHAEIGRLRDFDGIWEPACGDGAMVREMHALGLVTYGSDLIDRGGGADQLQDFYKFKLPAFPAIVTNPPFNECGWGNGKARWLKHALDVLDVEYMALLLNWTWPGAGGLGPFWAEHPCARVYLMRWKIDFTGQGAPPMLNGWFVWDKLHEGETVLRMLDRKDARQAELFGGEAA